MSTPTIGTAVRPQSTDDTATGEAADIVTGGADATDGDVAPAFAAFDVDPRIVAALRSLGIERTFAIQALTLPIALNGHDLIGQARTGMGKTLGFGVPLLHRLAAESGRTDPGTDPLPAGRAPRALIMVPTRELCLQVSRDLTAAAKELRLRVAAVYGGRAYEPQIAALEAGVDVVVGTPGRLLDLASQRRLILGNVRVLVLDEADEMLDLGFLPDIERVLGLVPERRQTMLFSATMPGPIIKLARTFMVQPTHIRAELPAESIIHRTTTQFVYRAHALDKVEMLARILQARDRGLTMVFTRTKRTAAKVAEELTARGFAAAAVHGDLGQGARERSLRAFRTGKVDVLVATDVAARGIDVDGVTHVVNFQCPEDEKTYIHRIGRTGRAGHSGVAVSFIDWDDVPRWQLINAALGLDFADPAETYSSSPHLRADLGIPDDARGTLPEERRTRVGLDAEKVEDIGETGRHHGGRSGRRGGDRAARRISEGARADRPVRRGPRSVQAAEPTTVSSDGHEPLGQADRPQSTAGSRHRARRRTRGAARVAARADGD